MSGSYPAGVTESDIDRWAADNFDGPEPCWICQERPAVVRAFKGDDVPTVCGDRCREIVRSQTVQTRSVVTTTDLAGNLISTRVLTGPKATLAVMQRHLNEGAAESGASFTGRRRPEGTVAAYDEEGW